MQCTSKLVLAYSLLAINWPIKITLFFLCSMLDICWGWCESLCHILETLLLFLFFPFHPGNISPFSLWGCSWPLLLGKYRFCLKSIWEKLSSKQIFKVVQKTHHPSTMFHTNMIFTKWQCLWLRWWWWFLAPKGALIVLMCYYSILSAQQPL